MKNEDKIDKEFVHLYLALRRKKENPNLRQLCCRKIIYDAKHDLKILKVMISQWSGIWRIHKTVNKRDCKKAANFLMHKLIDEPRLCRYMESLWKTCLLKPQSRAERNFLLDFDGANVVPMQKYLFKKNINTTEICAPIHTPNGIHLITKPFDIRILEDFKEVTVHHDGYVFIELFEVSDE
jgi:hypothetical protein